MGALEHHNSPSTSQHDLTQYGGDIRADTLGLDTVMRTDDERKRKYGHTFALRRLRSDHTTFLLHTVVHCLTKMNGLLGGIAKAHTSTNQSLVHCSQAKNAGHWSPQT